MRLIDVSGGPEARGTQYGQSAATEISAALATYRKFFETKDIGWTDALQTAGDFRTHVEDFDPDASLEMEAIAHGAKRSFNEILLLNARTELLYWHSQKTDRPNDPSYADECTGLIVRDSATANGEVIHAQNWDWMPEVADHTIALRIRDHDGPNALHFVEAGQLARHGMNENGLAVSAMGLHSNRDYGRLGVPSPLLRRNMIHAPCMGDAIAALHDQEASFSHAITLSHAAGEAFCFEVVPGGVFPLEPDRDVLAHANHFKSDRALATVNDANLVRCADSLHRDQRLRRLLFADHGTLTTAHVQAVLYDREHSPNSLCRAPAPRQGGLSSSTIYSLVMLPAEGRAHVAIAPWKGTASYQSYSIN